MFLDEYCAVLAKKRFIPVSISTIHRTFERAGLSVKRVQKLAKERSPQKRAKYIYQIGRYSPACLFFLDETSKDDRTYARLWDCGPVGHCVQEHNPFVCKSRYSLVGGMVLDEGIVAAWVVKGSYTRETFMKFLHEDVVRLLSTCFLFAPNSLTNYFVQLPCTTPFPGPRSIIVMDNA
ncbi:hypothetical protein C8J56DRAFT_798206 [Mycena floridula]|nr:hypothetical protein C8J56DRAFT_798206 [Mycena floridula]